MEDALGKAWIPFQAVRGLGIEGEPENGSLTRTASVPPLTLRGAAAEQRYSGWRGDAG